MVFVQPQFSTKSAKLFAWEIGGQVAVVSSPAKEWLDNLRHIAVKFKTALK
jgi:zinc transport system substrate-binding protein